MVKRLLSALSVILLCVLVNAQVTKLVKMYTLLDINKISKLDLEKQIISEVNNFIDMYYDKYTGLYLKRKEFLKKLKIN